MSGATLVAVADFLQVSTMTDSRDAATALANSAVAARLAASAQVLGPVTSVFWHKGEFGTGEEWQVVLKTTADRYTELEAHLLTQHGWENPEVTAIPLAAGSASYLAWVRSTVDADRLP
jgi:periplasmic divalent cation tolerance protein